MSSYQQEVSSNQTSTATAGMALTKSTVSVRLQGISRSRLRREGSRGEPRLAFVLGHAAVLECCTQALRQHRENMRAGRYPVSHTGSHLVARPQTPRKERRPAHTSTQAREDLVTQMGTMNFSFVAESMTVQKNTEEPLVIVNAVEVEMDEQSNNSSVVYDTNQCPFYGQPDYYEDTSSDSSSSDGSSNSDEDDDQDELPDYGWAYQPKQQITIDISKGSQEQGATLATLCYSWEALNQS